jgi:putative heme-binding domain-containing protein
MSNQRFIVALPLLLGAVSQLAAQGTADLAKGRELYLGMCSRCHGAEGGGGEGPNLNKPVLTRAVDDKTLADIIQNGIPDRGMPRLRRMSDGEVASIAGFVRSLGRTTATTHAGSREKGKALYARLGCTSCHVIAGEGGALGPELTSIGARRSPNYLRLALVEPGSALPRGASDIPGRGFNEFLPVRVVTRDGRQLSGVRVNEDSFTIQLRDAAGKFHSFDKADLQTLDKQFDKSLMPEYKSRTSPADLDDLVAYLASLGGAQ